MSTSSLSVVIIAKNADSFLTKTLDSVSWADEIILLDSGSDDNTVEIAKAKGAKVFTNSHWLGYGIQRQRAQRFATGDYIFMLDVDERITIKLRQSIQSVLSKPKSGIVYSIARRNYFLGRFMRYGGWYPDRVIRFYERHRYHYNNNRVHESLSYGSANIVALNGDLLHFTCCNFYSFQKKQLDYAITWAQERYQYGQKISIFDVFNHTIGAFFQTLFFQRGILDGSQGWILAFVKAQYTFNKYTELWALNHRVTKK